MTSPNACRCVCCNTAPVDWYELLCSACQPTAKALGLLPDAPQEPDPQPQADHLIQIGPTDI